MVEHENCVKASYETKILETPLQIAQSELWTNIQHGHIANVTEILNTYDTESLKLLLRSTNDQGETALEIAVRLNKWTAVKLLVEKYFALDMFLSEKKPKLVFNADYLSADLKEILLIKETLSLIKIQLDSFITEESHKKELTEKYNNEYRKYKNIMAKYKNHTDFVMPTELDLDYANIKYQRTKDNLDRHQKQVKEKMHKLSAIDMDVIELCILSMILFPAVLIYLSYKLTRYFYAKKYLSPLKAKDTKAIQQLNHQFLKNSDKKNLILQNGYEIFKEHHDFYQKNKTKTKMPSSNLHLSVLSVFLPALQNNQIDLCQTLQPAVMKEMENSPTKKIKEIYQLINDYTNQHYDTQHGIIYPKFTDASMTKKMVFIKNFIKTCLENKSLTEAITNAMTAEQLFLFIKMLSKKKDLQTLHLFLTNTSDEALFKFNRCAQNNYGVHDLGYQVNTCSAQYSCRSISAIIIQRLGKFDDKAMPDWLPDTKIINQKFVQQFKEQYRRKYQHTFFTNPFSHIKQKIFNNQHLSADEILQHAKEDPDSRTGKIVRKMDFQYHMSRI